VRDEGPLAHEGALQHLVEAEPREAGDRHDDRRPDRLRAVEQRQGDEQHVPRDPVAETARQLERGAERRERRAAIEPAAHAVFGRIDAGHQRIEGGRFHAASWLGSLGAPRVR